MKEILNATALQKVLKRLSHEIAERNESLDDVVLMGIRTRGVEVAKRIQQCLQESEGVTLPLGILDVTLYRDDILTCETELIGSEINFSLEGKTVILCDDVLYTGRTVRAAISALFAHGSKMGRVARIQLLEVVDRGHRELPFRADFIGKNIPTSSKEKVFVRLMETDGTEGVFLRTADEN
jgi:pyrimidine operon attenuation protein/uracil phosphoribosyltransferase